MEFLAIDLGTSFFKAGLVDVDMLQIRNSQRLASPRRLTGRKSDIVEINPTEVLSVVKRLIDELLERSTNCQGILMSGQMGGLILLDQYYAPVTPYISWQDRRTCRTGSLQNSYFEQVESLVGEQKRTILGNELQPALSLPLLYYLRQTQQVQLSESTIPVTLPDYVAAALCGVRPVTEITNSPGTISIVNQRPALELMSLCGIPQLDWPEVVEFPFCVGQYQTNNGEVPVYAATGDHQCSLVGSLLHSNELSVNVATGSQLSLLTTRNEPGNFQLRPFFDGLWLKTITNIPAGRALSTILRLLTEVSQTEPTPQDWDYFFSAAENTEHTDIDVNLGFFPGPVEGPGGLNNLNESNLNVGHIARASLQQMAKQYAQLAEKLDPDRTWKQVAFSGGLARKSKLLRQLVCESLETNSRLSPNDDDALFGLLILGRVIAGREDNVMTAIKSVASLLSQ